MPRIKDMLESFAEYSNEIKKDINLSYEAKRRSYGAKVLITMEKHEQKCVIIETFLRIKSVGQLKLLENTISSLKDCIEDYILDLEPVRSDDSDSDLIIIDQI